MFLFSRSKDDDNEGVGGGRLGNARPAPAATVRKATAPASVRPDASPRIDRKSLQAAAARGRNKVRQNRVELFNMGYSRAKIAKYQKVGPWGFQNYYYFLLRQ